MSPTGQIQVTGGAYQDLEGNPLALGYLLVELSHDESESGIPAQIVGGLKKRINLDSNGNIPSNPPTYLYINGLLTPANSYYIVRSFKADGTQASRAPQYWILPSSPDPYNVANQVPANPPGPGFSPFGNITLQTNGVNNSRQDLENLVAGSNVTLTNSNGATTIAAAGGFGPITLNTAYTGDMLVFNQFGDSNWDFVAGERIVYLWGDSAGCFQANSGNAPHNPTGSSQTYVTGTSTEGEGIRRTSGAGASTSVIASICQNEGSGSDGFYTFGVSRRYTARFLWDQSTNVRYWWGMLDGGLNNFHDTTYATDTPNTSYAGFRFSAGTDTHIQACCGTATASQTVVDTGVSIDTSASHLYDIVNTGSSFVFMIDGVVKATITTTNPAASSKFTWGVTADNKNTAHAVSFMFQWSEMTLK